MQRQKIILTKRMRRKYIFLLIGWLITIASFAAVPDKKPEKVLPVQEKVYLHFDNNCTEGVDIIVCVQQKVAGAFSAAVFPYGRVCIEREALSAVCAVAVFGAALRCSHYLLRDRGSFRHRAFALGTAAE